MTPEDLTDFFVASAGVAGALIGLLFVVLTVAEPRFADDQEAAPIHRVRAGAALMSFMNALTVSLFALVPGGRLAWAAVVVAAAGLLFVLATLLSLARLRVLMSRRVHEAVFLIGLAVVFVYQITVGVRLSGHLEESGLVSTLAMLVVACFVIGVYRAWDLVGGPSFDLGREVRALLRKGR
ncbi:hypothetical protein JIG36_41280 [Actinoplanes sp. LDG1-06]|uniref:DUF418 domain-containing protein n=1 Tax=Paractinoplanes ovalisporus TaxID=2810368 RepID=A0ABS2AQ62_9ACTN|nr:hypothetical protein [Actinoplanes ovalisporus]MBM2621954.1 hypothetical protein [Actinoplanes ovalisporus]